MSSSVSGDKSPCLAVRGLEVAYRVRGQEHTVLRDLSFEIAQGESFGLVGESGCGKSTAAMSIVRHLATNAHIRNGKIVINGEDILSMTKARLREVRARTISMVYQEPGRALNPSMRIERQVSEAYEATGLAGRDARSASLDMMRRVQISAPERVLQAYPHELSGGMQQRVVIAMALATNPSLLILDEPTTALDATVGADVLDIVRNLRSELGTSVLLISHNLALVGQICDRVGVLYAGLLVDEGPSRKVFDNPNHPYTAALLACIPDAATVVDGKSLASIPGSLPALGERLIGCPYSARCLLADDRCRTEEPPSQTIDGRTYRCFHHDRVSSAALAGRAPADALTSHDVDYGAPALLTMTSASKTYGGGASAFKAVDDVSLRIWPGETLGLVGESGSGKSTLGRMIMGLVTPDDGARIEFSQDGDDGAAKQSHSAPQMVFQNPDASLNRRHTVRHILGRAITKLSGRKGRALPLAVEKLASEFNLATQHLAMRPTRLSGGQKQRAAIARAFAGDPALVVCDEPTSALDVSVQAAVLNLFMNLQAKTKVAYLFISHDLGVVRYVSDRIAVMYLGQIVELGPAAAVLAGPHHPYTEVLLSAVPSLFGLEVDRVRMTELPADTLRQPAGCPFQARCPRKIGKICETQAPPHLNIGLEHTVLCHLPRSDLPTAVRHAERAGGTMSRLATR